MKEFLESSSRSSRLRRVDEMDQSIPRAAWLLLRWQVSSLNASTHTSNRSILKYHNPPRCISSCTSHLEELTNPQEHISNFDDRWHQFRFIVGSPDAEATFARCCEDAGRVDENAKKYPTLHAFHGAPTEAWHSVCFH